MNRAEKILKLVELRGTSVPVYRQVKFFWFIPLRFLIGYLWISDERTHWGVTIANGETSHNRAFGARAYGADFRKEDGERRIGPPGITGAWQTAITMWPVRSEEKAIEVFNYVAGLVDQAHAFHCRQVA